METKQLTQEEILKIKSFQEKYAQITATLGQIRIEQMLVEKQLDRLKELETTNLTSYSNIQAEESVFAKELETKYGVGEINIESGVFTPIQ